MPDEAVVHAQVGRVPRRPWRVAARCRWGLPSVIASPGRLEDGTPFPTTYWLTCPYLAEESARLESAREAARWAGRVRDDTALRERLQSADQALRAARTAESGGVDPCGDVGIAGQRDPLAVKCIHAHVALALVGIDDPIGASVLETCGRECADQRCAPLTDTREEA